MLSRRNSEHLIDQIEAFVASRAGTPWLGKVFIPGEVH